MTKFSEIFEDNWSETTINLSFFFLFKILRADLSFLANFTHILKSEKRKWKNREMLTTPPGFLLIIY